MKKMLLIFLFLLNTGTIKTENKHIFNPFNPQSEGVVAHLNFFEFILLTAARMGDTNSPENFHPALYHALKNTLNLFITPSGHRFAMDYNAVMRSALITADFIKINIPTLSSALHTLVKEVLEFQSDACHGCVILVERYNAKNEDTTITLMEKALLAACSSYDSSPDKNDSIKIQKFICFLRPTFNDEKMTEVIQKIRKSLEKESVQSVNTFDKITEFIEQSYIQALTGFEYMINLKLLIESDQKTN